MSSTFVQESPGHPLNKYEYSRTANPTRDFLQTNIAALEGGKYCICFSSGCAALNVLLQAFSPGSHVIISDDVYGGTLRLLAEVFARWNMTYTQCDMTNINDFAQSFTEKTDLVWIETPSNPLLKIIDIEALSSINKSRPKPALLAVDNTFATPFLQNPLKLGADLVCHSTTKYLGGHSDVIGGALVLNDPNLYETLFYLQNAIGACPSPMDCFLLLRSLKTLHLRMQAHCNNAKILADFLSRHPKVTKVHYPGLATHPQYELAAKQMRDFGGMISVVLEGDSASCVRFLQRLKLFTLAESLGGVESLIEHPASMTHAVIPAEHRLKIGIADTMVRISVGVEDPQDLLADLERALQ